MPFLIKFISCDKSANSNVEDSSLFSISINGLLICDIFESDDFSASLVDVVIETGRMHQIRAHAKHAGHELAGDEKYGDKIFNQKIKAKGLARLFLHASELQFTNPTTGELQKVSAPLSIELQEFIDKL